MAARSFSTMTSPSVVRSSSSRLRPRMGARGWFVSSSLPSRPARASPTSADSSVARRRRSLSASPSALLCAAAAVARECLVSSFIAMATATRTAASSRAGATSDAWPAMARGLKSTAIAATAATAIDSVRSCCKETSRTTVRYSGNATTGSALARAWTAKTAASAANGVARRTRTDVHDAEPRCRGRTSAPGNTPASPPLAGWKVRRAQSLVANQARSAVLTT